MNSCGNCFKEEARCASTGRRSGERAGTSRTISIFVEISYRSISPSSFNEGNWRNLSLARYMVTLPIKLILVTLLEALNPKHSEEVRPIYNRT